MEDASQVSTLVYHDVSLVAGNPVVGMSAEIIIITHGKPGQYSSIPKTHAVPLVAAYRG